MQCDVQKATFLFIFCDFSPGSDNVMGDTAILLCFMVRYLILFSIIMIVAWIYDIVFIMLKSNQKPGKEYNNVTCERDVYYRQSYRDFGEITKEF